MSHKKFSAHCKVFAVKEVVSKVDGIVSLEGVESSKRALKRTGVIIGY